MSKNGELRREDVCAEVPVFSAQAVEKVRMVRCHGQRGNQEWLLAKVGLHDVFFLSLCVSLLILCIKFSLSLFFLSFVKFQLGHWIYITLHLPKEKTTICIPDVLELCYNLFLSCRLGTSYTKPQINAWIEETNRPWTMCL